MLKRFGKATATLICITLILVQVIQKVKAQEKGEPNPVSGENEDNESGKEIFVTPNGCVEKIYCSRAQINSKYRTADGSCNNVHNPTWGQSGIPYIRYLDREYEDGFQSPRGTNRNPSLPTPRRVSAELSTVREPPNRSRISLMVMQWGQFMDHDLVFTPEVELEDSECCENGEDLSIENEECIRLDVTGDNFFDSQNVRCLKLTRSLPVNQSCSTDRFREQLNALTSYIDASQVYGSNVQEQSALRTFEDGLLKVGEEEEMQTTGCNTRTRFSFLPSKNNSEGHEVLFAGDRRVIEQPALTSIHTLFLRAHNDIATKLKNDCGEKEQCANDSWLFEEARRIVGALIQHITYNEFLPAVLGSEAMRRFNLFPIPAGTYKYEGGYDRKRSASTPNVFGAAVFRFGHSLVPNIFNLRSRAVQLAESFDNTELTQTLGTYPSDFLQAISISRSEGMDHFMVETLTNRLFADPPFVHGSDLYARNIMRGRDHGIPHYNAWRKYCELDTFSNFRQLNDVMRNPTARAFRRLFRSLNDIDLFPALISEAPENIRDGIVGPTLVCLLGQHFNSLKFADRYYYESSHQPVPFSVKQLNVIRSTTLASLLCAYTDSNRMKRQAMLARGNGNRPENCANIVIGTVPDMIVELFGFQNQQNAGTLGQDSA